jgi:hypothetical protein
MYSFIVADSAALCRCFRANAAYTGSTGMYSLTLGTAVATFYGVKESYALPMSTSKGICVPDTPTTLDCGSAGSSTACDNSKCTWIASEENTMTWGDPSPTKFTWSAYDEREYTGTATAISSIPSLSSLASAATTHALCKEACVKKQTPSCWGYVFETSGTVCKLITDSDSATFGFDTMKRKPGVWTVKMDASS